MKKKQKNFELAFEFTDLVQCLESSSKYIVLKNAMYAGITRMDTVFFFNSLKECGFRSRFRQLLT